MDRLKKALARLQDSSVAFLQQLVRQPSTQGREAVAQQLMEQRLKELGFMTEMWYPNGEELLKHPYFASPRCSFENSPNVAGILKGTGEGRSLLLNGHIDVVPEGDIGQWHDDPYSGKIQEGKLYGRGATDMKGGTAAMLYAIAAIQAAGLKLKGDLVFHSVIEEESGGAGTLAALLKGYTADAALIPEPSDLKIFPKQQGSIWFRIIIKGRSAHGGTRYEGVSAIEKSTIIIQQIRTLEEVRNQRLKDPLFRNIPIPIPINIGVIKGGEWPSSVADEVILEGRLGIAPEETIEHAKQEFEDWLVKSCKEDEWLTSHQPNVEWFGARWVPGSLDVNHDLMKTVNTAFQQVTGHQPIVEAAPWGTDGGLLSQLGGIPTIVFGPGTTKTAHYPNEYIELDKFYVATEVIAHTILSWCGVEE